MKYFNPFCLIVFILLLILFGGCRRKVSREELLQYIQEEKHGLWQEKKIGNKSLRLVYKPSDLLALQEIKAKTGLTQEEVDSIRNRYRRQLYVVLSFSENDKEILSYVGTKERFGSLLNQLAFGMKENLVLTTSGNDTIPLLDFHYPRMFGMAPRTDILLSFQKPDWEQTKFLRLEVKEFGLKTGDIAFTFNTRDIIRTPGIHFKRITRK